ncbi:MAG: polyprenyl diphosphate synthase, partial [bacterium]
LHTNNVRIQAIGDTAKLPIEVQNELLDDIAKTKDNTGLTLILALSYSGRWDLTEAIKRIADDVKQNKVSTEQIDENLVGSYLSTGNVPDPDLLVRTSGEFRISNFLLWQLAYTEIFITNKLWPAFRRDELYEAIRDYQKRERRFGMVSEQVKKEDSQGGYFNRLIKSVTGP